MDRLIRGEGTGVPLLVILPEAVVVASYTMELGGIRRPIGERAS